MRIMNNHYWKSTDGRLAITTDANSDMGEGWTEITYDQYSQLKNNLFLSTGK